jgi:hypothetical protein
MTDEQFYDLQPLAIFGVSDRKGNFAAGVYRELTAVGVTVIAVNPRGGNIAGDPIYISLDKVPDSIKAAVILTKGENAVAAVEECSRGGVEWIWLQGGSDTDEVRRLCEELEIKPMTGRCILLRKGRFPHSLHRFFHDLFKVGKSRVQHLEVSPGDGK